VTDTHTEDPILIKVQKLLDKAWSTEFDGEKQSLLAKADALMVKYSIDQLAILDPSRPNTAKAIAGQKPEMRLMTVVSDYSDTEVWHAMFDLFRALAEHLGCVTTYRDASYYSMNVVGYPADLDFLEMMYVSLKLDFMQRVDPQVVPSITWQENLLALKLSGRKWERIHEMLRQDHPNYPHKGMWERRFGVQFTGIYKKYRDLYPEEPANIGNPQTWRTDFCLGYVRGIRSRLREMRAATVAESDNLPALIKSKRDEVNSMFAEMFPPVKVERFSDGKPIRYSKVKERAVSHAAQAAGGAAAQRADLNQRNSRLGGAKGAIG
jgi:hypothetical protein